MKLATATFAPKRTARIAGALFLLTILAGIFAQLFVSNRLIVWDDAAATATNILRSRSLYEWSFTIYMLEMASQVAMTALFYLLLRPVNRSVALVALCLGLLGCVIKTTGRLFYLTPLFTLGDPPYLNTFTPEQLRSLTLLFLKFNDHAAAMALGFFGLEELLRSYLIFRSTFMPRALGVMSAIASVGWLTFLSPTLGYRVFPIAALAGLLASAVMITWLLAFGVNEQRWRERAMEAEA
jgi:hypothetical protein